MDLDQGIRIGFSAKTDATEAVDEFCDQTYQPDTKHTAFFCSSYYDLDAVSSRIRQRLGTDTVVGCTTAGEIGHNGYTTHSITGFSLAGPNFEAAIDFIESPTQPETEYRQMIRRLLSGIENRGVHPTRQNTFGVIFVDGTSMVEEYAASSIYATAHEVTGFGGSAGDDLRRTQTYIYANGEFRTGCVIPLMVWTNKPFEVFGVQSDVGIGERLVITEANSARRIVRGMNGEPAAKEYARIVGIDPRELCKEVFARHPLVVRVSGASYARSVIGANDDGSLTLSSAIGEGIVLSVGDCVDVIDSLKAKLEDLRARYGEPAVTICFDGVYRRVLAETLGRSGELDDLVRAHRVVGFRCYGVQVCGIHLNDALGGVMIGQGSSNERPGIQGPGSQGPGSQSPGSQSPGSKSPGSQSPGSQSPGSRGAASHGPLNH